MSDTVYSTVCIAISSITAIESASVSTEPIVAPTRHLFNISLRAADFVDPTALFPLTVEIMFAAADQASGGCGLLYSRLQSRSQVRL